MNLQTIACNNCGAPLAVPASANYVTCNHCGSQLAVKRDVNVTYTEKIREIDQRTEAMQVELDQLRADSDLAKLERDWEYERQKYMITDKGKQFWCRGFKRWCKRRGIRPRYGAIGQPASIAVVERFIRSMKQECTRHLLVRSRSWQCAKNCARMRPGTTRIDLTWR